jgi:hypothetical protein
MMHKNVISDNQVQTVIDKFKTQILHFPIAFREGFGIKSTDSAIGFAANHQAKTG